MSNKEEATELEWLRYFFMVADFGPADDDVRYYIEQNFMRETGKLLPEGYQREDYCEDDCAEDEDYE